MTHMPGSTSKPPAIPLRTKLKWVAVDLDATLAEGVWAPENNTQEIGAPIQANIAKVAMLRSQGWKIIIHTSRPWSDYELIETWLDHYRVPYDKILPGKLLAAAYIDDRAINAFESDWEPDEDRGASHATDRNGISIPSIPHCGQVTPHTAHTWRDPTWRVWRCEGLCPKMQLWESERDRWERGLAPMIGELAIFRDRQSRTFVWDGMDWVSLSAMLPTKTQETTVEQEN